MGDKIDIKSLFGDGHVDGPPTSVLVSDLLDHSTYSWDLSKINLVCNDVQAAALLTNSGPIRQVLDSLIWTLFATGSYTTIASFNLLSRVDHPGYGNTTYSNFPWNDFWRTKAPMRILLTALKIYNDVVPTFENLNRHHFRCEIVCPFCGAADDLVSHTFLQCSFARAVWFGFPLTFRVYPTNCNFRIWLIKWITRWSRNKDWFSEAWTTILFGLDVIWRFTNGAVLKNDLASAIRIIQSSVSFLCKCFYL